MRAIRQAILVILATGLLGSCAEPTDEEATHRYFERIRHDPSFLRIFLEDMPKGGDLHTHLVGAVYAENYLAWAAEDGLCVTLDPPAILRPDITDCAGAGARPAADILADEDARRVLINALSMRSFVPRPGYSGHDQFFDTFARMGAMPDRRGDMLAEAADRAAAQNIPYLEPMITLGLEDLFTLDLPAIDPADIPGSYQRLMDSAFGAALPGLIGQARADLDAAEARRDAVLGCGTAEEAGSGCDVEIRYLHQVIRSLPAENVTALVFAQVILGFHLMGTDPRFVGLNLVAPEDSYYALRDYGPHMRMIGYLHDTLGEQNITLHAGELALGLVPPEDLDNHIRLALDVARARRIGHGIDIIYEDEPMQLLQQMAEDNILVEVNLTSNDVILGVAGQDHPITLYRAAGVPVALSTDDEGVSRIDLTHEYQRAVETYGFTYREIKALSRNALEYSFLDPADKARLLAELEARFAAFEADVKTWIEPAPRY